MKLIAITTACLAASAYAAPKRAPNARLVNNECDYPSSLQNEADMEDFAKCFYGKYAQEQVEAKTGEYQRVAKRMWGAIQKAGENEEKRRKYIKSILINNANVFGETKQSMLNRYNGSEQQIQAFLNQAELQQLESLSNQNINNLRAQGENALNTALENSEIPENAINAGKDAFNAFKNSDLGKNVESQVNNWFAQNGEQSAQDLFGSLFSSLQANPEFQNALKGANDAMKNAKQDVDKILQE